MSVNAVNLYPVFLSALCAWREARGESADARRGVIWVIANRAATPKWWNGGKGFDPCAVILFPDQFSSFNANDPNATKWPTNGEAVWEETKLLAIAPGPDPTNGATSYYSTNIPAPGWALHMTFTGQIGGLRFFK